MTAKDLILKGKVAVRNSGTLYPLYISLFNEAFGYTPECPTCGSVNGHRQWDMFVSYVNGADPNSLLTSKYNTMADNKTFQIKDKSRIYSYNFKKEGQERDFTNRVYGDLMSEEFAIAYLDSAKDDTEILNQRKAEFLKLPEKYRTDVDTEDVDTEDVDTEDVDTEDVDTEDVDTSGDDLTGLKFAELQKIAEDNNYPAEEWEKLRSKADMIAYIEAKELDTDDLV